MVANILLEAGGKSQKAYKQVVLFQNFDNVCSVYNFQCSQCLQAEVRRDARAFWGLCWGWVFQWLEPSKLCCGEEMVYIWCGRSMVLNLIIFCFVLVIMWWIKTTPDLLLGDVEVRRLVHLKILGDYGSKGENAKTLTKQKERNWPDQTFRPAICHVGPGYTDKISNNVNPETWLPLINPCSRDNIISKNKIKISMACRKFFYVYMKMCLSFACERCRIPRIPFFTGKH